MTKADVQMVGRIAYLWGWPLVYVYNQRTELTKAPEPGLLAADPNQDVVYGLGYLSLELEPVVIQVPDFGDRFSRPPSRLRAVRRDHRG